MTESELYKELGALTKAKDQWEEKIPYVSSLLNHESVKFRQRHCGCLLKWGSLIRSQSGMRFLQLLPSVTVRRHFCGNAP